MPVPDVGLPLPQEGNLWWRQATRRGEILPVER
jgi:hypothetical protein